MPATHEPLTPTLWKKLQNDKPQDEWLLASRILVMKHAELHGYPSPETFEDTTPTGRRRLSFYDGNRQYQMIVEQAEADEA